MAVASGIAISVVGVLLVGWIILFFHKIQNTDQEFQIGGGAQSEFDFENVKEAQRQLKDAYSNTSDQLRQIRDEAAGRMAPPPEERAQGTGERADPFGTPGANSY